MNILLIGLGSIGRKHLQAIRVLQPKAEVYALRSGSKKVAKEPWLHNIYSLSELSVTPDFALISNPSSEHEKTIRSLLPLGIPLFIEKPAMTECERAGNLLQTIQAKEILTYVACNLRFLACLQFVKQKIEEGSIQPLEVNAYCGSYLPSWRPGQNFRDSYSANPALGGGVHFDLIHELDYLYWMFGKPKRSTALRRSKSSLQIPAVDYANYQLIYEHFVSQVTLNYYRKSPKRSLEILTDAGTWEIDLIQNQVFLEGNSVFQSEQEIKDTYLIQMEYFFNCLAHNSPSFNTLKDGIEVLEVCLNKEPNDSFTK